MKYLVKSSNEKVSGYNETGLFSAVSEIKKRGGLYITYVDGEKDSKQETSTAQGWASALCGKWMKTTWRHGSEWCLDDDYPTVLKTLSCKGFKTSFCAEWSVHFENTYSREIAFAQKNNLPQYFCQLEGDVAIYHHFIERISGDDDFIFAIFENPDHNGHNTGFGDDNYRYISGICNLDRFSYCLLCEIKKRETFDEEDWLVLIASDHGGHGNRHGTHNIQDATAFLAVSKPV
ncbi:MAG: alkaline phosphatase family protein [Clostridia bacterium]|nr:alkaline phosphatase family protein [Clostridia bacterium]